MSSQTNSQGQILDRGNEQRSVLQRSRSVGSSALIPAQVSSSSTGLQSSLLPQGQTIGQQARQFLPYQAGQRARRSYSVATQAAVVVLPPSAAVNHVLQTSNGNEISPVKMITNRNGVVSPTTSRNSPILSRNVNLRNVTIRPRRFTKPKLVIFSKNKVVCKNCGVTTSDADICARCSAPLQHASTTNNQGNVRERLNAERPKVERNCVKGVATSSFYNGTCSSDFTRYLKATSTKTITVTTRSAQVLGKRPKPAENVCITISSDSEDESSSATSAPTTPASTQSSITAESTETPNKRIRQEESVQETPTKTSKPNQNSTFEFPVSPERSPAKMIKTDEELSKTTLNLTVDSIRLGQMKLIPKSIMRISSESLSATVHCESTNSDTILSIKWSNVAQCDVCVERQEPCLYLVLNQGFLPQLRESLSMEKGKFPYFDPNGNDDEKLFIIYINSVYLFTLSSQCNLEAFLRKIDLVRKKLKRPSTFIMRISYEESERRQNTAAVAMKASSPVLAKSTLVTVQGSGANHIVTRHNTRRSSNQVPDHEEDIKMVFTGPRIELFVFPPPPQTGGISVTNEDRFCLNEKEFLNDVIIEFYLKYVYNKILSKADQDRTHIFSCFFYERLMQKNIRDKNKGKEMSPAERRHSQVKKWTRNVDIFSKDFIFVPINEAAHWYLAVICFPGVNFSEYECVANACAMMQKKTIEKLDATEVAKQVTQEPSIPETMQYLSNYGDDDEVQGSQVQSSNSQDERTDACQRSNVSSSTSQVDKSEEKTIGQSSSQSTHEGRSANVNSLPSTSEIKSAAKKRKLISIELPNFHLRKKPCQSNSQSSIDSDELSVADDDNDSLNSSNDKSQNLEVKAENENSSESGRTSPILGHKNTISKSKTENESKFIDFETSSKKPAADIKQQGSCHDNRNIMKDDETITLLSESPKLGKNLQTDSVMSQTSSENRVIGNSKQSGSDNSCEILSSSDESVCGIEISDIHSIDEDHNSDLSETDISENTKYVKNEISAQNTSYCKEKTINATTSCENLSITKMETEKCLPDLGISKSSILINKSLDTSENMDISITKNPSLDGSISSANAAKDSISNPSKCSRIEIDPCITTKDDVCSPTECSDIDVEKVTAVKDSTSECSRVQNDAAMATRGSISISTECSDIEIDTPTAAESSMSGSTECSDDHIDVTANNDSVFELYVSPGNTNFALSKDLERKCFISPNKRPQVQISRLPDESCIENGPIKISSSTSLSSDDSVIVLSSPDDVKSKNRNPSAAKKSFIKNESVFQSPKKVENHMQEVKGEGKSEMPRVECDSQEVKVRQEGAGNVSFKVEDHDCYSPQIEVQDVKNSCIVKDIHLKVKVESQEVKVHQEVAFNASSKVEDQDCHAQKFEQLDAENPCVVKDTQQKVKGLEDEVEGESQIAASHGCDEVKGQSEVESSNGDNFSTRHPSTGSVVGEKSLHLYLETSSHDLSNFDPLNSELQQVNSSDQQSSEVSSCSTTSNVADKSSLKDGSQTCGDVKGAESASSSEANAGGSVAPCEASNASQSNTSEQSTNSNDTKATINNKIDSKFSDEKGVDCSKTCNIENSGTELENCDKNTNLCDKMETNTAVDTTECRSQSSPVFKRPCILIFDSLRGPPRSKIATNLREYLTMEWNTRKKKTHGEKTFDKFTIKMSSAAVPQQDNYTDCGLFLLHYVEKFFSSPLQNYSPPVKLTNWFDPEECKTKRTQIKQIIDKLHEEWKKRDEQD